MDAWRVAPRAATRQHVNLIAGPRAACSSSGAGVAHRVCGLAATPPVASSAHRRATLGGAPQVRARRASPPAPAACFRSAVLSCAGATVAPLTARHSLAGQARASVSPRPTSVQIGSVQRLSSLARRCASLQVPAAPPPPATQRGQLLSGARSASALPRACSQQHVGTIAPDVHEMRFAGSSAPSACPTLLLGRSSTLCQSARVLGCQSARVLGTTTSPRVVPPANPPIPRVQVQQRVIPRMSNPAPPPPCQSARVADDYGFQRRHSTGDADALRYLPRMHVLQRSAPHLSGRSCTPPPRSASTVGDGGIHQGGSIVDSEVQRWHTPRPCRPTRSESAILPRTATAEEPKFAAAIPFQFLDMPAASVRSLPKAGHAAAVATAAAPPHERRAEISRSHIGAGSRDRSAFLDLLQRTAAAPQGQVQHGIVRAAPSRRLLTSAGCRDRSASREAVTPPTTAPSSTATPCLTPVPARCHSDSTTQQAAVAAASPELRDAQPVSENATSQPVTYQTGHSQPELAGDDGAAATATTAAAAIAADLPAAAAAAAADGEQKPPEPASEHSGRSSDARPLPTSRPRSRRDHQRVVSWGYPGEFLAGRRPTGASIAKAGSQRRAFTPDGRLRHDAGLALEDAVGLLRLRLEAVERRGRRAGERPVFRLAKQLEGLLVEAFDCSCQRNVPGAMEVFEETQELLSRLSNWLVEHHAAADPPPAASLWRQETQAGAAEPAALAPDGKCLQQAKRHLGKVLRRFRSSSR